MATNSLGRLTLDLVAKIGEFVGPMTQAEKKAQSANKNIADSFNVASVAAKAFGAVLAGASVAGVTAFVSKTIDAGNEIKKFSQLANTSMHDFQYYAKGAETAGISMESFADKMKDMQDRIGDFQQTGGGPLADFFENIAPLVGVTIQQFQKLSGPEALQLYYNSLEKVGATQNDMKFYMEAIISDSSLLIPLLKNGGEMFKFWGDAADRANAILSDDMIKTLEKAKVNLNLLDLQWQGFEATLVNNVMPVVQTVAENFDTIKAVALALGAAIATKLALHIGMLSIEFIKGVVEGVRYEMTLARMAGQTITLTTATVGLKTAMLGLVGGAGGLAVLALQALAAGAAFLYMKDSSDDAKDALFDQIENVEELTKKYGQLNAEQKQFEASKLREKIEEEAHAVELASNKYFALALNKEGIWNTDQIGAFNNMVQDVTKNGVATNTAFVEIKKTGLFSQKDLDSIAKLNTGFGDANTKLKDHQGLLKTLEKTNAQIKKSHDEVTASVNAEAEAYLKLNEKQRTALKSIDSDLLRQKYIKEFVAAGGSRDKAEYFAEYRNTAGLGFEKGKALSSIEINRLTKGFNSKNYSFTQADLKAIAKVKGIASANNFAQIEGLYGLPKGTLAALVLGESGGNEKAISPTGAKGLFQTTGVFRKQYGLNSNSSIEAQASAAAKDLALNLKKFGSLEKALMAYNAGAGGLNSYLKGGLSESKRKEVAGYVPKFSKYFAGVNGKNAVDDGVLMPTQAEILEQMSAVTEAQESLVDAKLEIDAKYYTKSEALAEENRKAVEKINLTLGGDPVALKESLAKQATLFKNQTDELALNKKAEYQSYFDFETDRIKQISQSYDIEKGLIQSNVEYTRDQKKELSDALDRQKQQEIDAVKREEDQMIQSATQAYQNETAIVIARYKVERDEILKNYTLTKETRQKLIEANSMGIFYERNRASSDLFDKAAQSREYLFQRNNPVGYDEWSMQNQYSSASSSLFDSFSKDLAGANGIEDEEERNAQLLETHERYLEAKAALDDEYAQRERDLNQARYEDQIGLYGSLLSQASSVWGSMTDMVKESKGEQSKTYKAMFLAQQTIAIGQQIINTELAAMQPIAQMGIYGIPASALIRGMGYASVGIIAAQTVAGMAHDGIDNIPKEGTWLLDKGERVLNPKQNQDLTRYLEGARQSSVASNTNVSVIMVKDEDEAKNYKYSKDFENAVIYHMKRNRSKV